MGTRGRRSAAELAIVTPTGERVLRCRPEAPDEVREVFARIVADVGADHFRSSDADLVEQYASAIVLARQAYAVLREEGPVKDGRVNPWQTVLEKANRASVALSQRLRLAPQSRLDRKTAGRRTTGGSAYDILDD
jgi:phage terminase small subunit